MRRLGTPADIGNAVTLLCSNEAGWITGQLIAVDGGMGLMDPACHSRFNSRRCRRMRAVLLRIQARSDKELAREIELFGV
jgi:hypothetical protein